MESNELPQGMRDYPGEGWPMFANYSELIPSPVRVGKVDVPQTFHTNIVAADESWILTLLYAVDAEEQEILFSGAVAGGGELMDLIDRVRAERSLRWWQRRALLSVVADVSERAAELIFDPEEELADYYPGAQPVDVTRILRLNRISGWRSDQMAAAKAQALGHRRNRVTREFLHEVADVYRAAWQAGLAPTQAVAEKFGRPHSTAARWVSRARQEELLGPADGSRGGEIR